MQPGLAIIAAVCCDGKISSFKCGKRGGSICIFWEIFLSIVKPYKLVKIWESPE